MFDGFDDEQIVEFDEEEIECSFPNGQGEFCEEPFGHSGDHRAGSSYWKNEEELFYEDEERFD